MPDFEWWEEKRLRVLADRGLDFRDAEFVLDQAQLYTYASPREHEARWVTIGRLDGDLIAVVWMYRGEAVRIISMRRARRAERRRFGSLYR